ncbi:MAG: carbohydrate binding domain-containing protein, partial [Bacteroidales bacterium]|nr:carbohydrate binding domain-containing protein [Bacteroidales bacterium]
MRKLTILFAIITLFAYGHVNGQQIKRNMIANAGFEEGLKHWLRGGNGVTFGEETENPISGTKSAKITVNQTHELLWGNTLKYFLPIKNGKRYKVSFKAKA